MDNALPCEFCDHRGPDVRRRVPGDYNAALVCDACELEFTLECAEDGHDDQDGICAHCGAEVEDGNG